MVEAPGLFLDGLEVVEDLQHPAPGGDLRSRHCFGGGGVEHENLNLDDASAWSIRPGLDPPRGATPSDPPENGRSPISDRSRHGKIACTGHQTRDNASYAVYTRWPKRERRRMATPQEILTLGVTDLTQQRAPGDSRQHVQGFELMRGKEGRVPCLIRN